MRKNSLELKDSIHQMVEECRSMVELCKKEVREMTEDEEKHFNELKEDIEEKKRELQELEEELKNYEEKLPEDLIEDEEDRDEEEKEEKNKRNHRSMKKSLVKELRNALENNIKSITVAADTRSVTVQGYTPEGGSAVAGVHDQVVETEIQGILEPLYAKSVLAQLGVKWYAGLPQGDVQVPIMGKSNVGWAAEIAAASATGNTFSAVTLSPKRLTAYVDISKQLLAQDTIGVENAIRRDIVNALNDKLEATIFGAVAGDTTKPAGIFYGAEYDTDDSYADVAATEAKVEAANVYGQMKYVMAPSTKAFYRTLIKGTNATGMVFENNEMDGTPAFVTSNIAANKFVYGDFSNLAIGSWGDIEITIDQYTQAVNGCVRLVINAYFDAKVLRSEAFAFGQTAASNGGAQGAQGAQG